MQLQCENLVCSAGVGNLPEIEGYPRQRNGLKRAKLAHAESLEFRFERSFPDSCTKVKLTELDEIYVLRNDPKAKPIKTSGSL